jgi:hypothetical protein
MKEEEEHYEVEDRVDWNDQPGEIIGIMPSLW